MQNSNPFLGKISIIIVNYRSDQHLEKCIASLYNFEKNINPEIIVVNNDGEKSLEEIDRRFPEVKILHANENLGFGRAINLGVKNVQNEILFFLNPDTEIKKALLPKILEEFAKNPEMAIISPQIVEKNGKTQKWTFGKKMNLWRLILDNIGLSFSKKYGEKQEVDWVSGAGMFVRREDFETVGGFDEKFFMYFEDLDLCLRIKKQNKKIIYFPVVELTHTGSGSEIRKKDRKKEYFLSQDYYFQKHYGLFQLTLVKILRDLFT